MVTGSVPIESLNSLVFKIPTDAPESDGTLEWHSTSLVLVELNGGGRTGLGYSYADTATATLIENKLRDCIVGHDAMSPRAAWVAMVETIRNLGRPGIASMAVSAVDTALWDLKARLLDIPLVTLLGQVREGAPVYGSGGFTSYTIERLQDQLAGWVHAGIPRVKMKVGRDSEQDPRRVRGAREAIGDATKLFVDANGGYRRKQALAFAEAYSELGVSWFEEPVSSDDLEGLRLLRDRAPAGMDIAAGEYGYDVTYFHRMLRAGSVDVLQADITRCGGVTGFLTTAALCDAHHIPLSAHCAPALHAHIACAVGPLCHVEYFHDHVRIENLLFDGISALKDGALYPDRSRPGNGLIFKRRDAEVFLT